MNHVGVFKVTGDRQEPFKFWSGPWRADQVDDVIAAALKGYPNHRFVTAEHRRREGVSAMGNPVSVMGYDAPVVETEIAA